MAELPPPPDRKGGWYPDPEGSGRLRFWRGQSWSDDFKDAPGGTAKPSTPGPAEPSRTGPAGPGGSGDAPEPPKKKGQWGPAPWWAWILAGFVGLIILGGILGEDESSNDSGSDDTATKAETPSVKTVTQVAPAPTTAAEPTATAAPAPPEEPEPTAGQENALEAAQDYLDLTSFSRAGLIQQLSSSAGEGFSRADATYAVNHVDVDWNEEAVEAAQDYLDLTSFSRNGLIEQLTSSSGEQFTQAQAEYAVNQVYGR